MPAPKKTVSEVEHPLPVGLTEFHEWADRIIAKAGQFADSDSMKWALASQILHLSPQESTKSDEYFVRSLRKAAANQIASQVFQDIKIKQAEQAAEAAKASDEQKT